MRALLVLTACLASASTSSAVCKCPTPFTTTSIHAPSDQQANVPLNTRIWLGAGVAPVGDPMADPASDTGAKAVRLLDPDLKPVALTETRVRDLGFHLVRVFKPEAALRANTTYGIEVDAKVLSFFTTGTTSSQGTLLVDVDVVGFYSGVEDVDYCADGPSVDFDLGFNGALVVADRPSQKLELDIDAVSGVVTAIDDDATPDASGKKTAHVRLAKGKCYSTWPEAGVAESTKVRFGQFNLAGQFSGWSQIEEESASVKGCVCTNGGEAMALVTMLGLLSRRRRSIGDRL